jgi:putative ABC transport system permease protein
LPPDTLPIADQARVMFIGEDFQGQVGSVSGGNFNDWQTRSRAFAGLTAFQFSSFNLAADDTPERVLGARTTHTFFSTFGVRPMLGRTYTAQEDAPGQGQVVVLSHRLWVRRFASNQSVLGTDVRMDGQPYTVIGVMPPAFDELAINEELWVPAAFTAERLAEHDEHFLQVVGRLRPGVSREQAAADLAGIYQQMRSEMPSELNIRQAVVTPFEREFVGDVRQRLLVLFGAVTFVLLIACGNVAHLLLARGGIRAHEIALRTALGAGRVRIVRQLLTETVVLSVVGGVLGVIVVYAAVPALVALSPEGVPRLQFASVNGPVLAFALLASVVSAVVAGLTPAIAATRPDLRTTLNEGGRTAPSSRERLRFVLVAAEVSVAVVLLAGAGLLVRSAVQLQAVNPGFDATGVLTARVSLPATAYDDAGRIEQTFTQMAEALGANPAVAAAALTSDAPMTPGGSSNGLVPEGQVFDPKTTVNAQLTIVTPDYLRVLRIPLVAGRWFTADDRRGAQRVMLLNETAARRIFPGENAIGKRIGCCEGGQNGEPIYKVVVGIVRDVRGEGLEQDPSPQFYLPIAQVPPVAWTWLQRTMTIVVRGRSGDPGALTSVVRSAVAEAAPTVPLFNLSTMDQRVAATVAQARFNTLLMLLLGAAGLLLAAIGIYGVVTYFVAQRRRELAIRMALGAPAAQVMRMVVAQGLRPVVTGIVVGIVVALLASRVLTAYVFGITTRDPLTMAAVVVLLLGAALLAAALPARRAARVDPASALFSA